MKNLQQLDNKKSEPNCYLILYKTGIKILMVHNSEIYDLFL